MIQQLSQRDQRWGNIKLGTSELTISNYGCTITTIAMIVGTTPDVVNAQMNRVGGFAQTNLVIWDKIKDAFPSTVESVKRLWTYDNDDVKINVPCIVQVDGTPLGYPTHFVVFIGGGKMIDPWDGKIKSTGTYTPVSYCVIKVREVNKDDLIEDLSKKIKDLQETEKRLAQEKESAIKEKDDLISHLNQIINDRNNDISRCNSELSTVRQQVTEIETQKNLAVEQAKQLPSLKDQLEELERQKEGWSVKESELNKQIKKLSETSFEKARKRELVIKFIKKLFYGG